MNLNFISTTLELGVVITKYRLIKVSEGPRGVHGAGVPVGGSQGQILAKATSNDYDTLWINPPAGAGSPNITVSATAPGSPAIGDLWVDTS
jgi:hypothetical protein